MHVKAAYILYFHEIFCENCFVESIVATETSNQDILSEGLQALLRPVIRSLFVGRCHAHLFHMSFIEQYVYMHVCRFGFSQ